MRKGAVDLVFANEAELHSLYQTADFDTALRQLRSDTGLGVVTLPIAAWAFGRLAVLRRPGPACLAVAMVPFLFERTFTIYGGNIASTLAGEFAFSIGLSLCLLFLGVFAFNYVFTQTLLATHPEILVIR